MLDCYSETELRNIGFAYLGTNVTIYRNVIIPNPSVVSIDSGTRIDDFVVLNGSKITIGKRVHIANFCAIGGGGELIMEDYTALAVGCKLITGTDDFSGNALCGAAFPIEFRQVTRSYIHLKKHAIMAANVTVLPGVTCESGAVAGTCSLVHRNLKEWTIYLGNPAIAVKARKRENIEKLAKQMVDKYGY